MERKNIAVMIKIASIMFEKIANPVLAEYDLTFSQFKILKYLIALKPDKPIRQKDLEDFFLMSNATVTGILNNLEKKGLIERRLNPEDKRSKLIVPTEKALGFTREFYDLNNKFNEELVAKLTNEEREEMCRLLAKIIY